MKDNQESLEKELSKLKLTSKLSANKKEEIVMALQKEAKKKKKRNRFWVYFPTAAVIFLCGFFIYNIIIGNDSSPNANDPNLEEPPIQQPTEDDKENEMENPESNDDKETDANEDKMEEDPPSPDENETISITEGETREITILVEGMEEKTTATTYTLEPYSVQFEIAEYMNNYDIVDNKARFFNDTSFDDSYSKLTMEVRENTTIDAILSEVQQEYASNEPVQEVNDLPSDENGYVGVFQSFYDPPQGFYLYQIDNDVFVIQYQYGIEGGDGMDPRLELLRKSIK